MSRLLVSNGLILDPVTQTVKTSCVYIADGHIIAIDHEPDGFEADHSIDATGLVVSPGFIDIHSHSDFLLLEDGNAKSKIHQAIVVDVLP